MLNAILLSYSGKVVVTVEKHNWLQLDKAEEEKSIAPISFVKRFDHRDTSFSSSQKSQLGFSEDIVPILSGNIVTSILPSSHLILL
jgi:hypothetical protein